MANTTSLALITHSYAPSGGQGGGDRGEGFRKSKAPSFVAGLFLC